MTPSLTFGEWLEDQYLTRGFTQTTFADAVGVAQSTVSAWVTGKSPPRRRAYIAIARALDLPLHVVRHHAEVSHPTVFRSDPRPGEPAAYTQSEVDAAYARLTPDEQRIFMELLELITARSEKTGE